MLRSEKFGKFLRALREDRGWEQEEVAQRTGISRSTISSHENGHTFPSTKDRRLYARSFGFGHLEDFDQGWRRNGTSITRALSATPQIGGDGVPILGEVMASGLVESAVYEDGEPERLPISFPGVDRVYGLRIRGTSMMPTYHPGEIVIVQDVPRDDLQDGEDAVIQCDGGADSRSTFKRVEFKGAGIVKLVPLNRAEFEPSECKFVHIARVGRIVGKYTPREMLAPKAKG